MADDADRVTENIERQMARIELAVRYNLPKGKAGDCDICGEWSGRLINGACAPCRDKYNLE